MIPWLYALMLCTPMSSPQMTRMLGLPCACAAPTHARPSAKTSTANLLFMARPPSLFKRENPLPVRFHADDNPLLCPRLVERLVEPADRRLAVVGELALGVVVAHDQHQPSALPGLRELQHLQVAVGIAERGDRAPPDGAVDAHRLSRPVVDEGELRLAH